MLMANLSPLNLRGLIASQNLVGEPVQAELGPKRNSRSRPIECWKCSECFEVYDDEDEARDCCARSNSDSAPVRQPACPVCNQGSYGFRDAADCCLWKDMDTTTRWRVADAVEAGSSWPEQLLGLAPQRHLGS